MSAPANTQQQQPNRGNSRRSSRSSFSSSSSSCSSTSSSFSVSMASKGCLQQQVSGLRMNNGRVVPNGGSSISNSQEACRSIVSNPRPDLDMGIQREIVFGSECSKKQARQQSMARNLQMNTKMVEFRLISLIDEAATFQQRRGGEMSGAAIRKDQLDNSSLPKPAFPSGNKNCAFMLSKDLVKHIHNDIRTLLYDTTMTSTGAAEPSYAMKQIHGLNLFLESTYGLNP